MIIKIRESRVCMAFCSGKNEWSTSFSASWFTWIVNVENFKKEQNVPEKFYYFFSQNHQKYDWEGEKSQLFFLSNEFSRPLSLFIILKSLLILSLNSSNQCYALLCTLCFQELSQLMFLKKMQICIRLTTVASGSSFSLSSDLWSGKQF